MNLISISKFYIKYLRNFYFRNYLKLKKRRIILKNKPIFNQKTIITGKGRVEIGESCVFGYKPGGRYKYGIVELQTRNVNALIKIADNVFSNNNLFICAANYIEINDFTLIGEHVTIFDFEAHGTFPTERRSMGKIGFVKIGKNVWIGNNVTILKNVQVGENTIIATGSIVTKSFPANVIIGGIPAKIISRINTEYFGE